MPFWKFLYRPIVDGPSLCTISAINMARRLTAKESFQELRSQGILGYYFRTLEEKKIPAELFGNRVLDLGAGTGRLIPTIAKGNRRLVEMDVSLEHLTYAKSKAGDRNGVFVICADGAAIPFKDKSFSGVICLGTFEYMCDLKPILMEIQRICCDQASLLFTCYNRERCLRKFFFSRLEEKCVEHTLMNVAEDLRVTGFRLIDTKTLLFMPRRLFWVVYNLMPGKYLRGGWVIISLLIELFLGKVPFLKNKGQELLVSAQMIR